MTAVYYCNMCGIQISSPGICNECDKLQKDLEKEKKK